MSLDFLDFKVFAVPGGGPTLKNGQGDNQKGVLVAYQSSEDKDALEAFLSKILTAVDLDIQKDIFLYHVTPDQGISLSQLARHHTIRKVITFGLSPSQLGLRFRATRYRLLSLSGVDYLFADPLADIYRERQEGKKERAGLLWNALQMMFPKKKP